MENRLIPSLEGSAATLATDNMAEQAQMGLENFGKRELQEALGIFERYRSGKQALEARMIEEQLWWRRRHYEMFKGVQGKKTPAGAQLFNAIENKIADIYDNIPDCSFLARSRDDEEAAQTLTDVMPAILEEANIEKAYMAVTREKVTVGTGVYTVVWDKEKRGGIGDICIRSVSPLNLYWEPGIEDIQESPNLFYVSYIPTEQVIAEYPELKGKLGGAIPVTAKYLTDDEVDDTQRTAIIDFYYKRKIGGRTMLHYAKICGDEVLFASENMPEYAETGWYKHGKYPFVFDVMFPLPDSPCGFGYVTVGKDSQYQIDKLNNAITRNAVIAATRRKYIKKGAGVNKDELMDIEKDVVEISTNGALSDAIMTVDEPALSGNYIAVLQNLEERLKEVTANRDFANGGTSGGVTSGTAISALVEAGNKQSRAIIRASYDAYKEVVTLAFELEKQFDIADRSFRIKGAGGEIKYTTFSAAQMGAVPQTVGGVDIGTKEPVFDILIRPHKKSPFARVTQNTMMQEFYGMGFFNPENATPALACLEGMEFDGKDELYDRIAENGTLFEENMQLKQSLVALAAQINPQTAEEMAMEFGMDAKAIIPQRAGNAPIDESPDIMRAQTDKRMVDSAAKIANSTGV